VLGECRSRFSVKGNDHFPVVGVFSFFGSHIG
jgi:hypothetical protein